MDEEIRIRDLKIRIEEKIKEVEECLRQIIDWIPEEFKEYEENVQKRLACERSFEIASESLLDIAIYFIRLKEFRTPNDDESTFKILSDNNIISEVLCKKMIEARGMRNFVAHRYGKLDNEKVFYALKEEFPDDVEDFLDAVKNKM